MCFVSRRGWDLVLRVLGSYGRVGCREGVEVSSFRYRLIG